MWLPSLARSLKSGSESVRAAGNVPHLSGNRTWNRQCAGGRKKALRLLLETLEDRLAPAVFLNYEGPGTVAMVGESTPGTNNVQIFQFGDAPLRIDLGSTATFDPVNSTPSAIGLAYETGSPGTSHFAIIDIIVPNSITTLMTTLPAGGLILGPINANGGVGNINALARTIDVAGPVTVPGTVSMAAPVKDIIGPSEATIMCSSLNVNAGSVTLTTAVATLNATATNGNVNITNLTTTGAGTINAMASSSVQITQTGNMTLGSITAGTNVQITQTGGNLTVGSIRAGTNANLTASTGNIVMKGATSVVQASNVQLVGNIVLLPGVSSVKGPLAVAGHLDCVIAGPSQFGQLAVGGPVSSNGVIVDAIFQSPFLPSGGQTFPFLSSSLLNGNFTSGTGIGVDLGNGTRVVLQQNLTDLTLKTLTILPANTSTAVVSSNNPSVFGQPVTFTAIVTPQSGSSTPTGTIQFVIDGSAFGNPVVLSGGTAPSMPTSSLSVGTHMVMANYSSDASFLNSSGTLSGGQVVNRPPPVATMTSVSSSANPSVFGQPVTFTATVKAGTSPVTQGTVTFKEGSTVLTSGVSLNGSGQATFSLPMFSLTTRGEYTVSAHYIDFVGNATLQASSGSVNQTVKAAALEPDPLLPSKTALFVGGPPDSDHIEILLNNGQVVVKLHASLPDFQTPLAGLSSLVVYGQGNRAHIQVDPQLVLPAFLFAGNGANTQPGGPGPGGLPFGPHIEGGGGPAVEVIVGFGPQRGVGVGGGHLEGGRGRNILIAGMGGGHLEGKGSDDILIGGSTDYDSDLAKLAQILAQWNSAATFSARTAALAAILNATTVHDNGVADHLEGGGGMDWFFGALSGPNKDKLDGFGNGLVVGIH
jgi:hypothetical protein